jgi:phage terminase Nu1 subunit (DNA packaging protein)
VIDMDSLAAALIRQGIAAQLSAILAPALTPLVDRAGLADLLGVQPAQVDRWRRAGMPVEYVGRSPRFSPAACRAWLAERATPRSTTPAVVNLDEPLPGVRRARRRVR